jgi:hypothetical protein
MKNVLRRFAPGVLLKILLPLCLLAAGELPAQYIVYQWDNLENSQYPPKYSPIGTSFDEKVKVVGLSQVNGLPPGFRSVEAARETGQFGLAITSDPKNVLTGLATGTVLQREKLGAQGKALYQADFYFPAETEKQTNFAVLAMLPMKPGQSQPQQFYRFGVSKLKALYFSFVEGASKPQTEVKTDKELFKKVPKASWHRLSIVFEGRSRIRCFVDGREASFSPIEEGTLKELQVGILNAENKDVLTTYVDNMSIQWTPEDVPLPDSPYAASWGDAPSAPQPANAMTWLTPEEGKAKATASGRPMFVYMHAPRVAATQTLNQILDSDPKAREFLKGYVPVKIDVNQLQGGTIARHLNVSRIPTVILMQPNGAELGRTIYVPGKTWEAMAAGLTKPE